MGDNGKNVCHSPTLRANQGKGLTYVLSGNSVEDRPMPNDFRTNLAKRRPPSSHVPRNPRRLRVSLNSVTLHPLPPVTPIRIGRGENRLSTKVAVSAILPPATTHAPGSRSELRVKRRAFPGLAGGGLPLGLAYRLHPPSEGSRARRSEIAEKRRNRGCIATMYYTL